ncbi:MAG: DUF1232 domain-containing protein [Chloroflexi bacterium]|nr:DUF1232 domain-containing protein [Chloroflexota bacterium]
MLQNWKNRVRQFKFKTYALYLAYRDLRTPWYARLVAAAVVAYAFSPIDLIPDFIPVLGYLDDLVIVPLGIFLALKLIPPPVMADAEAKAEMLRQQGKPVSRAGAIIIVAIWLALAALGIALAGRIIGA